MKQKVNSDQITKSDLQEVMAELYEKIKVNQREESERLEARIDMKMENQEVRIDDKAREYRNETMTRFDGIMGELVNAREERAFLFHENKQLSKTTDNHEQRITTLEQS